jgi:hypothetical protein
MPSLLKFKKFRYLVLASPVLLAGCGEGWEMVRTDQIVPYGNTRTAGTGVAYVRAKMLPKKELNLQPAPAPVIVAPPPAAPKAEEVFRKGQQK